VKPALDLLVERTVEPGDEAGHGCAQLRLVPACLGETDRTARTSRQDAASDCIAAGNTLWTMSGLCATESQEAGAAAEEAHLDTFLGLPCVHGSAAGAGDLEPVALAQPPGATLRSLDYRPGRLYPLIRPDRTVRPSVLH
jgi:hypothetical protein